MTTETLAELRRRFVSVPEAAQMLEVNRSTLHRWIKAGELEPTIVGRTILLGRDEVITLKIRKHPPKWVDGKIANYEALAKYLLSLPFDHDPDMDAICTSVNGDVDLSTDLTPEFADQLRQLLRL